MKRRRPVFLLGILGSRGLGRIRHILEDWLMARKTKESILTKPAISRPTVCVGERRLGHPSRANR